MKCRSCGAELATAARFCQRCGTKVEDVYTETFTVSSDDLTKKVKELFREGNVTRIVVKDEAGKELIVIPATVGLIGAVIAPWLAAIGVIAAMATKCTLLVERRQP
jgi:CBS domain-containing protein